MIPRNCLAIRKRRAAATVVGGLGLMLAAPGCGGGVLDAGHDEPHGPLPVDERNPLILDNDAWHDNWQGEYAMLLANKGTARLLAIIASDSRYWPDVNTNVTGWNNMVTAARSSGLKNIPDVTASAGAPLTRPSDGVIENTVSNNSAGGNLIVELSRQHGLKSRPLVVVTGAALTNLAEAYLLDRSVVERVVVVSSLGSYSEPNGIMSGPNGDLDPWANWIVAQRFTYVQISAYYGQTEDVAETEIMNLPKNPFGTWMADKQPGIFGIPLASDQVGVLSVTMRDFVRKIHKTSPDPTMPFDAGQGLQLRPDPAGNTWTVSEIAGPLAKAALWQMLLAPDTFAP